MVKLLKIGILGKDGKIPPGYSCKALSTLLGDFETKVKEGQIPTFTDTKISFKTYLFEDYPDQKAAKEFIKSSYTNCEGDLYWAGVKFEDFEVLYNELSKQKFLAELCIDEVKY